MGFEIILITTIPHYVLSQRTKARTGLEIKGNLKVLRLWIPRIPHDSFNRRLVLYVWFMIASTIPTLMYARKGYLWAFSQRVFSTYSCLLPKIIWRVKLISDITDVWPEALVNTGYANENSFKFRFGRFLALIAYKTSDKISTLTPAMARLIVKNYRVKPEKITIIPNIGDHFNFQEPKFTNPFIVLYYGNLGKNYDFEILLETAKIINNKSVLFVIKGNGEQLTYLKQRIKEMNLRNVHIITKILTKEELQTLVQSANVLILPMKPQIIEDTSFPIKLVEYLHQGRPIIYMGNGFAFKLIRDHNVGLALNKRKPEHIANFILELMENKEKAIQMAYSAKNLASKMFSEEKLLIGLKETFNQ
jgi:glycosyltransferase involved in cell wall biosynthesis